ncbi:hypothetical protein D1BOALGB6SA_10853 [Olavius sp. associated proteobacterium Delta 1]|nr:hypothetical protein D1BOALGB6SA_10853 [Olavius sp. associated proteobacterium Delta 1]
MTGLFVRHNKQLQRLKLSVSQKEPWVFYIKKSSKYWIWGSICIIFMNFIFFIFRNFVHETVLLWVVILTPVACLILYPFTRLLGKDRLSGSKKGS